MPDRSKLPYRKNCEGYFILDNEEVIVRDTGKGYLEFPGGGVDEGEDPKEALIRETFEETGAIVEDVKEIGKLNFIWDENWAKTEKQKARYEKYKGEEMHFFVGKAKEMRVAQGDKKTGESGWEDRKTMPIAEALNFINSGKPFSKDIKEYREFQIQALNVLKDHK